MPVSITATRCPAPRVNGQTRDRSGIPGGLLGAEPVVTVAHTSRCTVGDAGAGRAGFGNHLSSICGGETACAVGVPSGDASAQTSRTRAMGGILTANAIRG